MRAQIKTVAHELVLFGIKQASASLFGGFLLGLMLVTSFWYPLEALHRYDFIFLAAIAFQLFLLLFKFETPEEALTIAIFHVVATVMELYKTSDAIGSWRYPEAYFFGIGTVPLFTGFMYSAVGSYIARAWRIFEFCYESYPNKIASIVLVFFIYLNFFTHHFMLDLRWFLLAIMVILFHRTKIHFKIIKTHRKMPLLLGWFLVAFFIWIAENCATFANIWIYPNQQEGWRMVPLTKLTSWFLLMLLSFVLVTLINETEGQTFTNAD